jgi:ABC-2 type transport system permease protein
MINDSISQKTENPITIDQVKLYLPLIMAAWISMSTFMSSITSSMISLEGKKFSILKSLPVKPYTIIKSKILMTVILMLPILLVGTIMVSLRCGFSVIDTVLLCAICIALTFVAETYGIICNLKFPKMDAENDTEVVKQSTSSFVAVMGGMFLVTVNGAVLIALAVIGLNISIILGIFLAFYAIVYLLMKLYLNTKGTKIFNKIQV